MLRVAAITPELKVADVAGNLAAIEAAAAQAAAAGCRLAVFPELAVTGYTCGDLFGQRLLLEQAERAVLELASSSARHGLLMVVGVPLRQGGRLFNVAVVLSGGRVCGAVPKRYLPNSQEFYERRWFAGGDEATADHLQLGTAVVPFGTDLLFPLLDCADGVLGIEICEDAWVASPPSGDLAAAGATLIANLSASPETLGKCAYRRALVEAQSARCLAGYIYASAGPGESSTDLVFAGHSLVAEYGQVLAEAERFRFETTLTVADLDLDRLMQERLRRSSFADSRPLRAYRRVTLTCGDAQVDGLRRPLSATPFVPASAAERAERCREIFAIQTTGLMTRLRHTGSRQVVLGISGGLDSTLALLVTAKAFDRLGWPRQAIVAVTMPGFGTTGRTRGNAEQLAQELGVTLRTIAIDAAVSQHFRDIGHDPAQHDITFENAQARERTQILMDIANQVHGLVIGTGDLSELALGWCTYNGDHMAMYAVNAAVPKTLVRYLIDWCAEAEFSGAAAATLHDVCATPVSPELLPPHPDGTISQHTEAQLGPYEVHDFFLYQVVRCHFAPRKVLALAVLAFGARYAPADLRRWLVLFYRRFFAQQFKRSCLPDGPKVGSVALSPRGDWRMPSDAVVALWLAELEAEVGG
jgi:NAD+ synthase (glutamine-hydrolysing)